VCVLMSKGKTNVDAEEQRLKGQWLEWLMQRRCEILLINHTKL
jgi:hypothetical protein